MIEGILIKGPLTEEDAKEFAETMRRVEQKRPNETFMMTIINELGTNKALALLNTVFPAIQGVPYDVKSFKRDEDHLEEVAREKSLGATGEYPHGTTGPEDQGELKAAVYIKNNRLFINFGKQLSWLALTKQESLAFGNGLVKKAKEMP
jgi:hypothetical protein